MLTITPHRIVDGAMLKMCVMELRMGSGESGSVEGLRFYVP